MQASTFVFPRWRNSSLITHQTSHFLVLPFGVPLPVSHIAPVHKVPVFCQFTGHYQSKLVEKLKINFNDVRGSFTFFFSEIIFIFNDLCTPNNIDAIQEVELEKADPNAVIQLENNDTSIPSAKGGWFTASKPIASEVTNAPKKSVLSIGGLVYCPSWQSLLGPVRKEKLKFQSFNRILLPVSARLLLHRSGRIECCTRSE